MITRLRAWWRDPEHRRDERSNSFALFIVMLPIILGAFGLGVDMARNVYIKSSIEHSLNAAVTSGAAAGHVNSSGASNTFDKNAFIATTEEVYAIDRQNGPGLSCQGTSNVPGTHLTKCWAQPSPPTVTRQNIPGCVNPVFRATYTVQEKSRNAFLQILGNGLAYQTYTVEGVAIVGNRVC